MIHHIGLNVSDLDRSVAFYEAALRALGFALTERDAVTASFSRPNQPLFYLTNENPGRITRAAHIAFEAHSEAEVARFYEAGLNAGGRDHGKPGLRTQYAENYYACFLLDPDDNNIEAVFFTSAGRKA